MPNKYNKTKQAKQRGGFDYLSNKEFVKRGDLAKFEILNDICKKAIDTAPILKSNVSGLVENRNRNRNKIRQILLLKDSELIIKDLMKLSGKLDEQVENISGLVNKLNVDAYYQFLNNLNSKTTAFTFENLDFEGDIPDEAFSK